MLNLEKYVALKDGSYIDVNIEFDYTPSDAGDRDTPPSGSSVEINAVTALYDDDPLFEFANIEHLVRDDLNEACIIFAEDFSR